MEVLELLEKMKPEERRTIIEQINAMWPEEEPQEDPEFLAELQRRAEYAIGNPQSGIPWAEVRARLLGNQKEQEQNK